MKMPRLLAAPLALFAAFGAMVRHEMEIGIAEAKTDYDNGLFPFAPPDDPGAGGIQADDSVFISAQTDGVEGVTAMAMSDGVEFSLLGRMTASLAKSIDTIIGPARRAIDTATAALMPIDTSIGPNRRLALAT